MHPPQKTEKIRVIDSFWTFTVALVVVGPLALPLLWRNPRLSRKVKWVGSIVIIIFTAVLLRISAEIFSGLPSIEQ